MRVKIGDTWYNDGEVAICIDLLDIDKERICNMGDSTKYASFPDHCTMGVHEKLAWMTDTILHGVQ